MFMAAERLAAGSGLGVRGLVLTAIPGVLSQRPAVLAGQLGQQPAHERGCSPPGFHPSEVAGDTAQQLTQGLLPAGGIYAWACGHRLIFGCLHSAG
jgi:hypothetical protein